MKKILIFSLFVAIVSGCSTMKNAGTSDTINLEGKIQKIGMTTYQYGTHTLSSSGKNFALKSATLNLDTYLDQQVTIKGQKVAGYPLDGGPELIEVTEVAIK